MTLPELLTLLAFAAVTLVSVMMLVSDFTARVRYWYNLVRSNTEVLLTNRRTARRAELALFSWKEHGLWMHDVALDTLTVITQLEPHDPQALAHLHRVAEVLRQQLEIIDGAFTKTFRCTPEEWRARRSREKPLYVSERTGKAVDREDGHRSSN